MRRRYDVDVLEAPVGKVGERPAVRRAPDIGGAARGLARARVQHVRYHEERDVPVLVRQTVAGPVHSPWRSTPGAGRKVEVEAARRILDSRAVEPPLPLPRQPVRACTRLRQRRRGRPLWNGARDGSWTCDCKRRLDVIPSRAVGKRWKQRLEGRWTHAGREDGLGRENGCHFSRSC
eukprot:2348098-Prymnesium_polylepis.1